MAEKLSTLTQVIQYWAEHQPDTDCFIFLNKYDEKIKLNSKNLYLMAGRFASRLRDGGFVQGDVIANALPNSPERVVTDFGIVMAGCITMNCQILEKDGSDFWNSANVSKCKGIIVPPTNRDSAFHLLSPFLLSQQTKSDGSIDITIPKAPTLKKLFAIVRKNSCSGGEEVTVKVKPFLEDLLASDEKVFTENCLPADIAYIFVTSGTTGYSKLVAKSHEQLLKVSQLKMTGPSTKFFSTSSLGWGGGFPYDYFSKGGPVFIQDALEGKDAKTAREIWAMLEREHIESALILSSIMVEMMSQVNEKEPVFKLKALLVTGQPIKKNVAAAVGVLADVVVIIYASTETGTIAMLPIKDASEFKDNACGYPCKGVQVRIVDEQGQSLPPGKEGTVHVKSETTIRSYYNFTPAKPVFTDDGWFMIQDRGMIDEKGMLYIFCREGDVISQDDILIYFSWPEGILVKCPQISEVKLIALKDNAGTDKLCACVSRKKGCVVTEQDILDFYDNHFKLSPGLKTQMKPKLSHVLLYDSLPATKNGKMDIKKMKADAIQKFGYSLS